MWYQVVPNTPNRLCGAPHTSGQSCWLLIQAGPPRLIELELRDLLAQRLVVVAGDGGADDLRLDLLDLEQIRREISGVLRHQQVVDDLAAIGLDQRLGRRRGRMAPHVVVRQQQPVLADRLHRVGDRGLREVRAVAVPHELDAAAVLARLARRRGIGIEEDGAMLVGDLGDRVGDARVQRADQDRAILARDEALGDARAGSRARFRVRRDPLDLAAEHAALGVPLVDDDADGAMLVLAAVAELAADVVGETELDRLLALRVGAIVMPTGRRRHRRRRATPSSGCPSGPYAVMGRAQFCCASSSSPPLRMAARLFDGGSLFGHRIIILSAM